MPASTGTSSLLLRSALERPDPQNRRFSLIPGYNLLVVVTGAGVLDGGLGNGLHGSAFGADGRSVNERSAITRQKGDDVGHFSGFG